MNWKKKTYEGKDFFGPDGEQYQVTSELWSNTDNPKCHVSRRASPIKSTSFPCSELTREKPSEVAIGLHVEAMRQAASKELQKKYESKSVYHKQDDGSFLESLILFASAEGDVKWCTMIPIKIYTPDVDYQYQEKEYPREYGKSITQKCGEWLDQLPEIQLPESAPPKKFEVGSSYYLTSESKDVYYGELLSISHDGNKCEIRAIKKYRSKQRFFKGPSTSMRSVKKQADCSKLSHEFNPNLVAEKADSKKSAEPINCNDSDVGDTPVPSPSMGSPNMVNLGTFDTEDQTLGMELSLEKFYLLRVWKQGENAAGLASKVDDSSLDQFLGHRILRINGTPLVNESRSKDKFYSYLNELIAKIKTSKQDVVLEFDTESQIPDQVERKINNMQ